MRKAFVLLLLSILLLPCLGAVKKRVRQLKPIKPDSVSIEWMLHKHVQRVLRQDGSLILPVDHPVTNYMDRVVMNGADALPSGYYYLRLRDEDSAAQIFDQNGNLIRVIAPNRPNAEYMLADLFGFELNEDTPEYLKLSHVTSKWRVFNSKEEDEAYGPTEEELEAASYLAMRMRVSRLADAPNVVTTLQCTAHSVNDRVMESVYEWPSTMTFTGNKLDIFVSSGLETPRWYLFDTLDVAGLNAVTTTVNGVLIPGWHASIPLTHESTCFATTNIVEDAFELGTYSTNIYWNCDCRSTPETPGFNRAAEHIDSDGDGLSDYEERWQYDTDPENWDSDNDGMPDGWEVSNGLNPRVDDAAQINGNGVSNRDEYEIREQYGLLDSDGDYDEDGISDIEEIRRGLDPKNNDSDGDGVEDGEENRRGTSSSFDESNMEEVEGVFYEIIGTAHTEVYPYDPSTNQTPRVVNDSLPPNQPGTMSNVGYEIYNSSSNAYYAVKTGLSFRPTRSGFFAFQIAADDRAEVSIGDLKITDNWQILGSEVVGYFEQDIEYPITAKIWNNGGRTYFNFVRFGVLKAYQFGLIHEVDSNVLIFENSYYNKPAQVIPKKATYSKHAIAVSGGTKGGMLSVSFSNESKLRAKMANYTPVSFNATVAPFQVLDFQALFEPITESGSANDITINATFTENETGTTIRRNIALTSIKVEVEAKSNFPSNKHRHVFGPRESIELKLFPENLNRIWSFSSEDILFVSRTTAYVKLPKYPEVFTVTVNCLQSSFTLPLQVIAPERRICIRSKKILSAADLEEFQTANRIIRLTELWTGMILELKLFPYYVSFGNIIIFEGECETEDANGSLQRMANVPHDYYAGAYSNWEVSDDNDAGKDLAFHSGHRSTSQGWLGHAKWPIPVYWMPDVDYAGAERQMNQDDQVMDSTSDGYFTVRKFSRSATRANGGQYYEVQ